MQQSSNYRLTGFFLIRFHLFPETNLLSIFKHILPLSIEALR